MNENCIDFSFFKAETMDEDQKKKIDNKSQNGKQRQNKFTQEEPSSKQKYPQQNKFQKAKKTSHQQPEDISEIKPYKRKVTYILIGCLGAPIGTP